MGASVAHGFIRCCLTELQARLPGEWRPYEQWLAGKKQWLHVTCNSRVLAGRPTGTTDRSIRALMVKLTVARNCLICREHGGRVGPPVPRALPFLLRHPGRSEQAAGRRPMQGPDCPPLLT